jgi:hypothetical protein
VDIVLGVVLIGVGVATIARSQPISERLRRDRWPFGNVYALRKLNPLSANRVTVILFGCGVMMIGVLGLVD